LLPAKSTAEPGGSASLTWTLYRNFMRLLWALLLVSLLTGTDFGAAHLSRPERREFPANARAHYAGQLRRRPAIWGAEQVQGELNVAIYHTKKSPALESEDPDKRRGLKKPVVRKPVTGNPFGQRPASGDVRQNPRKKGSAFYDGYETDCAFAWSCGIPRIRPKSHAHFPLPAQGAMYDSLAATLNGRDVLPDKQIKDASLVLERNVTPEEAMDSGSLSRAGVSPAGIFQVRANAEIRDFRPHADAGPICRKEN